MPGEEKVEGAVEDEQDAIDAAEAEELAGFEAAMEGKSLPKTEKVEEEETAKEDEKSEEEPPAKTEPEKVEPKLATLTEEQLTHLINTANSVSELKATLEKLRDSTAGKIGGIERTLKEAESKTDSGIDLELADEDFQDVENEVPLLSKPLQKTLKALFKKAKVKVPGGQKIDLTEIQTQIQTAIQAEVEAKRAEDREENWKSIQRELLTDRYPDWKETVAKPEFKTWMEIAEKETPGYQAMFRRSWSAQEIGGVLKKFNAHVAEKAKTQPPPSKPKPKVIQASNQRTQRLAEAIPPKGSSKTPAPKGPMTEEEAFELAAS